MIFLFTLHYKVDSQINTKTRKAEFESIAFRIFDFERILNSQDPDGNFIDVFDFKDSQYFTPEEFSWNLNHFDKNSFSMLPLNVRRLQKKFNSLCNLLMWIKFEFKVIYVTETWWSDNSVNDNLFKLPKYKNIPQVKKTGKDGIASIKSV